MQRLIDSQSLLSNLVEQTSDMLTATDVHFRHVSWNKAAEYIFGITAEQIIGKDLRGFLHIEYNNRLSKEDIREILLTKGSWKGEASFIRPTDGCHVTIIVTIKQLLDENNSTVGYLLSGTDITERKLTEQVIRESENRFREMADSAPVMIWMSDVNNKITYVNRTWLRSTGVDLVKIQSVGWVDLVHPDDVVMAKRKIDKHFNLELPVVITYRLKQYDDTYRWVQETGIPRKLADGTFVGFIGSIVDIHDQKLKEEQLGYQATILDNVSDIIITYDMDNHIETWNHAAEDYYSISATDAIGKKLNQLISINYINSSEEQELHELKRTGFWKGEKSFLNSKGETCYLLDTCKYIYQGTDKKVSLLSVSRDISDRKKAEESILQSEKFYRTLIADSSNGTILSNADGIITYTSHAIKPVLGYEEDEILGRNLFDFVHPDDYKWAMESFQKEIDETPDVKSIVIRLLQKSGNWLWCMIRGHNLLDNQYVKSFVIYFHDDTHRKNANDALKESEKRFRSLIRDLQIGVLLQDRDGKIFLCNTALCNLFLLKEQDII
ncbi:MAG TPA: PAS domain S-box protein, partial [Flavisolibacter sp.]|nr:PAS domain S-box protein [Flavisolibacter sp.]